MDKLIEKLAIIKVLIGYELRAKKVRKQRVKQALKETPSYEIARCGGEEHFSDLVAFSDRCAHRDVRNNLLSKLFFGA